MNDRSFKIFAVFVDTLEHFYIYCSGMHLICWVPGEPWELLRGEGIWEY